MSLPIARFMRAAILPLAVLTAVAGSAQVAPDACPEGLRLFRAKDYASARGPLEACLQANPEDAQTLQALTIITTLQSQTRDAVTYGERFVALAPQDAAAYYWYGRALLGAGRLTDAEAQWERGLLLSQDHAGILEGLARMALRRGEDAKAYNLLNQLQLQGVDEGWVHRLLSDIARRRQLWETAADHWSKALDRDGETADDLLILGELRLLAGDGVGAIADARRAVALRPDATTWGGLGEAFFAADQPDSAAEALARAVAADPEAPRHRYNLANVFEILGRTDESGEQFARYVALVPDDPMGHLNYGIHLKNRGELTAALAELDLARELDPKLPSALVARAQVLEQLGRADEAIAVVEELQAADPQNHATLSAWIADLREQQGLKQAGKVLLQHLVTGDPAAVPQLGRELAAGADFAELAMRFSTGPTAAKGGDIGWVDPASMVEPLRRVIEDLEVGETSPLVEAGGLHHAFKRIR